MDQNNNPPKCSGINVYGGNVQINPDVQNSTINQNNYNSGLNVNEILSLIEAVKKATPSNLSEDEAESLSDSLSIIESEVSSSAPKKSFLRNAVVALKAIKGTAEFAAAVATLIQFVQTLL